MTEGSALLTSPARDLDAIYFLMFPGWENELRSNRWHYASRWARHMAVTLVQSEPVLALKEARLVREPRLDGCHILHVRSTKWDDGSLIDGLIQAEQIRRDIARRGFRKVAFWLYDPSYFMTWGMLPATVRVVHATENYFMYTNNSPQMLSRLRFCLQLADLAICCSDGVAASYRPHVGGRVETITNGCEYEFYAGADPDPEMVSLKRDFERVAVFAGNIDERLDYEVLALAAERNPRVLLALFGPTNFVNPLDRKNYQRLVGYPNVRYFGKVPVERLPSVYAACDVGLLPYVREPLLYENTFPLKTFEMIATGLPVVARNLRMIAPYAGEGVIYEEDDARFVEAIGRVARGTLSESAHRRMKTLALAQDYDAKFEGARKLVEEVARANEPRAPMRELFSIRSDSFEVSVLPPASLHAELLPVLKPVADILRFIYRTSSPVRALIEKIALRLPSGAKRSLKKTLPNWIIRFIVG